MHENYFLQTPAVALPTEIHTLNFYETYAYVTYATIGKKRMYYFFNSIADNSLQYITVYFGSCGG